MTTKEQQPPTQVVYVENKGISGGAAALLTLFIPGLGQLLQGRVFTAITIFVVVMLCHLLFFWLFFLPGLFFHFIAIIDAARN